MQGGQSLPASIGMPVFHGDVIQTPASGSVSIIFRDDYIISLGPERKLNIMEYVFEPKDEKFSMFIKMIQRCFISICLMGLLAGCASHRTTVVLVPDPQGHVGKVAVQTQGGEQLLSESGQAVIVENEKDVPSPATQFGEEKIRAIFGKALDAEPPVPEKFILYFKIDSTELLPDSKNLIQKIINSIHQRSSFDISINGHADRAGTEEYNFDLSMKRADYVEKLIVQAGIDKHNITKAFHGEGNPVIPTPDGVAERRNRRVEVIVR